MRPICADTGKCFAYHNASATPGCGFRCGSNFEENVKTRFLESLNENQRKIFEFLQSSHKAHF